MDDGWELVVIQQKHSMDNWLSLGVNDPTVNALLHSPLLFFRSLGIHNDLEALCGGRGTFEVQVVKLGDPL